MTKENKLKIFSTKDYSKFRFSDKNRDIVEKDVDNLVKSIEKHGNSSIITCRETKEGKYEILNGQHRFEALKQLGLEINFQILNGEESLMIDLNRNQSNWKPADYLKYGVASGIEDYIKLNSYFEQYKVFKIRALTEVFGNGNDGKNSFKFKNMTWKIVDEEMGKDIIKNIQKFYHVYGFREYNETKFMRAFTRIFQLEGFSCTRLMAKMDLCSTYLKQQPSISGYYEVLNRVYNHNTQGGGSSVDLVYMLKNTAQRNQYG